MYCQFKTHQNNEIFCNSNHLPSLSVLKVTENKESYYVGLIGSKY